MKSFEKIFDTDELSKRERVCRALTGQKLDRVPIHEQLSYNPEVISHFTGRDCSNYDYTAKDVGQAIKSSLDCCFIPCNPLGTNSYTDADGFKFKNDNWTTWRLSRPFSDEEGAKEWLIKKMKQKEEYKKSFNPNKERENYRRYFSEIQNMIGETVFIDYSLGTGFCFVFDMMGLEIYSYFSLEYPDLLLDYMEISTANAEAKVRACGGDDLSPAVLIAEDFSTKQGPIFSDEFLRKFHYPFVKRLTDAWHSTGMKVIYHSDGNYKRVIPDLAACGVDGFYCLEPACGMDIVGLSRFYPEMLFSGSIDGVDLMERGTPEMVLTEAKRQIKETGALDRGRMFLASSSEINPTIPKENYLAMVNAAKNDKWN